MRIRLVGLVVLVVVYGGKLLFQSPDHRGDRHSAQWGPHMAPLAAFIENVRGRPFKHAVPVKFLEPAAFDSIALYPYSSSQMLRISPGNETKGFVCSVRPQSGWANCVVGHEEVRVDNEAAELLGLVSEGGRTDVELADLTGGDLVGVYRPSFDEVLIRGPVYEPAMRATLVHELTHAWQQQHYGGIQSAALDGDQRLAMRALVEGDAERMESAHLAMLMPDELAEVAADAVSSGDAWTAKEAARRTRSNRGNTSVTDERTRNYELSRLRFPYTYGTRFVRSLLAVGGERSVDAAFGAPPRGTSDVLHPGRARVGITPVPAPAFRAALGVGYAHGVVRFGEHHLRLMLSQVLPLADAVDVATSWHGDSLQVTENNGDICVDLAIAWDPTDVRGAAMAIALLDWANSHGARLDWSGGTVEVSRCRIQQFPPSAPADRAAVAKLAATRPRPSEDTTAEPDSTGPQGPITSSTVPFVKFS